MQAVLYLNLIWPSISILQKNDLHFIPWLKFLDAFWLMSFFAFQEEKKIDK